IEAQAIAHLGVAFAYSNTNTPQLVYEHTEKALTLFKTLEQPEGMADCHRILGISGRIRGEFDVSADHFEKCFHYSQEINDQ
ncbi:MAG TPA: hypothetical protein PLZ51_07950, partial [Aggregatilineales bacterium]|nr:hypothetical protein [Aggregatilineales bacterium]